MKKTTPEESESIELTENQSEGKTIYQKRLDRQSQQQVKPATAYSLLSVLAVVLVIVVFVLPRFVAENEETISDKGIEDGNTEVLLNEAVLAQKPIAEALLSEMLSKMDDLKSSGVQLWAEEQWLRIRDLQSQGDDAYLNRVYDIAAKSYREAMQLLTDLEISIPETLEGALQLGQKSILQGDKNLAIANFETALAIDGGNELARKGLDRALKLDTVIEYTQLGESLSEQRQWSESIGAFEKALVIDPEWLQAQQGLSKAILENDKEQFQSSLSKGYALMKEEKFDEAEAAFQKSLEIDPESKAGQQAIEELEIQRRTTLTKSLKYKGLIAEVNEEWDDAKSYYETILNFDSNIGEVKDSLMRVNSRIRLINQMISFIAQAENLNDQKLFNQAQQALIQAQSIMNKGPKMTQQISELEQTLKIASTPVEVTLISDLKTDVVLYKTGKFGLFEQKIILLKPGVYTAKGTRIGYRDTTLRFKVTPENSDQRFIIICRDRI